MRELVVWLEGRPAGTLTQNDRGSVRFTYEPDYATDPSSTPLSLAMPTSVIEHPQSVVRPWMSNLLPDNERVLQRWGQEFKVSPSSPFRLLEHVGADVAGAARLLRPDADEQTGTIDWLSDAEMVTVLAELASDPAAWTPRHALGHFSLAGAQAKTALRWDGHRWGRPNGSEPTTHIVKPSMSGLEQQALNEHLCLSAAARAGLAAARTRIENFGGTTAIVVERYDRILNEEGVQRIHQEDLCQALRVPPNRKYQTDGGPSVADIARLMRSVTTPARAEEDIARFVRALAFSWVIASTDGHAKNYSVLLSGTQVRLAPLYDVHSVLPYLTRDRRNLVQGQVSAHTAQVAMRIGSQYGIDDVTRTDWELLADAVEMDHGVVLDIVQDVAERAPDAFARVAADEAASGLLEGDQVSFADRLATMVAKRSRACAAVVQGRGSLGGRAARRPRSSTTP